MKLTPTVNEMEAKRGTGRPKFGTNNQNGSVRIKNVFLVQQLMFVGGKHKKKKREKICVASCDSLKSSLSRLPAGVVGGVLCLYTSTPIYSTQYVHLTVSLVDGGGLVGRAWVCVAFGTPQTQPTTSGTGVRAPSINAPSFLGLASAAVSTARRKRDNRRDFGGVDVPSI